MFLSRTKALDDLRLFSILVDGFKANNEFLHKVHCNLLDFSRFVQSYLFGVIKGNGAIGLNIFP
jgi:hypothetical protein